MDDLRAPRRRPDVLLEAQGRRSSRDAAAQHARAHHRARGARRGFDAGLDQRPARGVAGAGARGGPRASARARGQPGRGRDRRRLERRRDRPHGNVPRTNRDATRRSSSPARRARRARERWPFRSCACRRPSGRPAASPWTSSAPARSTNAQPRDIEPADAVRSRRHHRRPRIAVDGRVPVRAAGCRQRVEIADRQRVAIYPAGGSRRERRGSAIRRARGRGRQDARAGALRGPQQPAELPGGHAAAAGVAVERVARRPSRASGPDGGRRPPAAAAEGAQR